MDHLTWPDAFAVAAVAAFLCAFLFILTRAQRGIPASKLDDILLHRERMAERPPRRPVPDFSEFTKTTSTTVEVPLTPEVLDALVKIGAFVKNEDGTWSVAAKITETPTPLVTPSPESPKEPPDAVS